MTTSTCETAKTFHMMTNGNTCLEYFAIQCPKSCGTCEEVTTATTTTASATTVTPACEDTVGTITDDQGKLFSFFSFQKSKIGLIF